jgi:hypothetical protein
MLWRRYRAARDVVAGGIVGCCRALAERLDGRGPNSFVPSGFLITHHLLNRWPERFTAGFLLRYWAKRVLRTFPAHYTILLA